jgi:hypothetical protein
MTTPIPRRVRIFATPLLGDRFAACITDAENINITLHLGPKCDSIASATSAATAIAKKKGWTVAPRRRQG